MDEADLPEFHIEEVELASLKRHPRNYKDHPEDQLEHIAASLRQLGFYKNIVIARDGTILAGHGLVQAATEVLSWERGPVYRMDLDPDDPLALLILANDNELPRFAEVDDRSLSELLRDIAAESLEGLLGTGYDEMSLAALVMTTRYEHEVPNMDHAREWAGMPDYEPEGDVLKIVISFRNEDDRQEFLDHFGLRDSMIFGPARGPKTFSAWWPPPEEIRHDSALNWQQEGDSEPVPTE